jgi:hypothetical protein
MNAHADLVYFWAAILIVLTPLLILGSIGWLVVRQVWKERGTRKSERGTDAQASVPGSAFRVPR